MTIVKKLKKMLKEAELYRKQGLLVEAKNNYASAAELLKENIELENSQNLIDAVLKKISSLDIDIKNTQKGTKPPEVSPKIQNLIMNLFSFADNNANDISAIDGAIALAKFGQYERALKEFEKLIKNDSTKVDAAKNILKCHQALSTLKTAAAKFNEWLENDIFSLEQMTKIHKFLQNIFDKEGSSIILPKLLESDVTILTEDEMNTEVDDEILEISAVGILIKNDSGQSQLREIDVSFQSGNILSLIFSKEEKEWIDSLKVGQVLNDIQFYSPIAMFAGTGAIASKTKIKSGPKKNDYCLDLKIVNL